MPSAVSIDVPIVRPAWKVPCGAILYGETSVNTCAKNPPIQGASGNKKYGSNELMKLKPKAVRLRTITISLLVRLRATRMDRNGNTHTGKFSATTGKKSKVASMGMRKVRVRPTRLSPASSFNRT